jgi:hypothetical protein
MAYGSVIPETTPSAGVQRPLIATGLSLAIHLVVLILGVLLLQIPARVSLEEGDRPVSIVLAARSASSAETSYFDETTSAATEPPASAQSASGPSGSALPDASSLPIPSSPIALPGAVTSLSEGVGIPTANVTGARSGGTAVLDSTEATAEILAAEAKRPRASGPVGPQGEMSVFGTAPTRGHSFVFVIDRSHSMGSEGLGAIAAAEKELLAGLEKLKENHQFQIVAYNQSPSYFRERKLISVSGDSLRAGREFLENLATFGATDHERALVSVMQLKPDVVYLLTDGDPVLTASQRKRIREESGGRTVISCIQFGRIRPDEEATRSALEALAKENRGSYVFVDMARH